MIYHDLFVYQRRIRSGFGHGLRYARRFIWSIIVRAKLRQFELQILTNKYP